MAAQSDEKHGFSEKIIESNITSHEVPQYGLQTGENDALDMQRLGKAQEFNRNFSYISTLGFTSVSTCALQP